MKALKRISLIFTMLLSSLLLAAQTIITPPAGCDPLVLELLQQYDHTQPVHNLVVTSDGTIKLDTLNYVYAFSKTITLPQINNNGNDTLIINAPFPITVGANITITEHQEISTNGSCLIVKGWCEQPDQIVMKIINVANKKSDMAVVRQFRFMISR